LSRCSHPLDAREDVFPASDYVTGDRFQIQRCGTCGLAFTWPWPEGAAMDRYYPEAYYGTPGEKRFTGPVEAAQRLLYGWRARRVEKLAGGRPGRVLDVGCGRGFLLDAFRRRGWTVEGTELSESSSGHAREVLGIPVHLGMLPDLGLPAGSFDAITMWHVLEHVTDHGAMLAEIRRLLRPGGVFLVAVPNFGSPEAQATRAGWFHLDVPRHLLQFTPDTLRGGLRDAGMEELESSFLAPEYDAFSFVQSLENRLGLRQNLLYDRVRGREARFHGEPSPLAVAAAWLLAVPLGILSLPVTLVAGVTGRGATLTVAARRT
jgi:SAM-dependent methyltransferase